MKLLKNFSLYSLGRIVVDGLKFFLIPLYTTYIPVAEFGLYSLLMSLREIVFSFFNKVAQASYARFFFKDKDKPRSFSSIVSIYLFSFAILVTLVLLFSSMIREALFSAFPQHFYLLYILLAVAFAQFFVQTSMTEFMMQSRAKDYFIFSLVMGVLPILLILYMVLQLDMTIDALILGLLAPYSVLAAYVIFRKRKDIFRKPDFSLIKKYNSYGIPLAFNGLSAKILKAGDRFIIQFFLASTAVGAYSFVYMMTTLLQTFIIQPFTKAINPITMKNEDNHKVLQRTVTNASLAILVPFSIITIIFAFFIEYLLGLFVSNPDYMQYMPLLYLLSITPVIHAGKTFAGKGLQFSNKTYIITGITIAAAVSNVIMNFILIPIIGIWGAVIATVLSYLMMLLLQHYYSEKHHPLRYPKTRIYTIITTYSATIGLFYLLQGLIHDVLLKTLLIILYITLLWLFRILTRKNIEYVIRTIRKS